MDKVRWGILSPAMIAMKRVIPAMREASNAVVSGIASRDETRAREAAALGFRKVIVPHSNASEIRADIEVVPVRRIEEITALI